MRLEFWVKGVQLLMCGHGCDTGIKGASLGKSTGPGLVKKGALAASFSRHQGAKRGTISFFAKLKSTSLASVHSNNQRPTGLLPLPSPVRRILNHLITTLLIWR